MRKATLKVALRFGFGVAKRGVLEIGRNWREGWDADFVGERGFFASWCGIGLSCLGKERRIESRDEDSFP